MFMFCRFDSINELTDIKKLKKMETYFRCPDCWGF